MPARCGWTPLSWTLPRSTPPRILDQAAQPRDESVAAKPADAFERLIRTPKMVTSRSLSDYLRRLPDSFGDHLLGLGPAQQWADMGCGDALAQATYGCEGGQPRSAPANRQIREALGVIDRIPLAQRAQTVGITVSPFPADLWRRHLGIAPQNPPRILAGRFLEEIPDDEIGRCDLISDLFGVFCYSDHPDRILKRYLDLLSPEGAIYLWLGSEDRGWAARCPVQTREAKKQAGSLRSWLESCRGLVIDPQGTSSVRIRRGPGPLVIPGLRLEALLNAELPPLRSFRAASFSLGDAATETAPSRGWNLFSRWRAAPTELPGVAASAKP